MSEKIQIRIRDFYSNAVGDMEYTYVSQEVYEALVNTFRKEAHAEKMRDIRNISVSAYEEGGTEEKIVIDSNTVEEQVIYQMDIELLQIAIQSLTKIQGERLYLYFFKGLSIREIAKRQGANQNAVWKSLQSAIKKLKKFFD